MKKYNIQRPDPDKIHRGAIWWWGDARQVHAWTDDRSKAAAVSSLSVLTITGLPELMARQPIQLVEVPEEPKPKLRPWTHDEAIGKTVTEKAMPNLKLQCITCTTPHYFTIGDKQFTPQSTLDIFVQPDGKPCGVEEK